MLSVLLSNANFVFAQQTISITPFWWSVWLLVYNAWHIFSNHLSVFIWSFRIKKKNIKRLGTTDRKGTKKFEKYFQMILTLEQKFTPGNARNTFWKFGVKMELCHGAWAFFSPCLLGNTTVAVDWEGVWRLHVSRAETLMTVSGTVYQGTMFTRNPNAGTSQVYSTCFFKTVNDVFVFSYSRLWHIFALFKPEPPFLQLLSCSALPVRMCTMLHYPALIWRSG